MQSKQEKKKSPRKLTIKEQKLVKGILQGKSATQAAKDAGYSHRSARQVASETLSKPDIQALIASHAEIALGVIHQLTTDPDTPHAVRLNGAKDILDRAGYKPIVKSEVDMKGEIESKTTLSPEQLLLIAQQITKKGNQQQISE